MAIIQEGTILARYAHVLNRQNLLKRQSEVSNNKLNQIK